MVVGHEIVSSDGIRRTFLTRTILQRCAVLCQSSSFIYTHRLLSGYHIDPNLKNNLVGLLGTILSRVTPAAVDLPRQRAALCFVRLLPMTTQSVDNP